MPSASKFAIGLAGLAALLFALWHFDVLRPTPQAPATPPANVVPAPVATDPPTFVGSAACAKCHADEYEAWRGSQHAVAMEVADERTVLGDFDDAKFSYFGITSRFFRRDGRFMVRTDGPDGKLADFEVRHTFGVQPLQQYLIELPGGRVQALSIAWDTRPADAGRAALVPPVSRRAHRRTATSCTGRSGSRTGTSCAPTATRRCAQELRRRDEHLRDDVLRHQRRLRGLPWAGQHHVALAQQAATEGRPLSEAASRWPSTSAAARPG
jgi:hypothetical protein